MTYNQADGSADAHSFGAHFDYPHYGTVDKVYWFVDYDSLANSERIMS